ncbi:MAG: hypothetical protein RLZZ230_149 [Candidatus Parcubacteria bacterium]|jgi:uncharacterized hydrophobic protein (TIGR00271 family)
MPEQISSFLKKLLDLREGAEEKHAIIENIKDDADFSSARFWTLVFAIFIASVGLNINSIPVIIGAMLISPLMGPIVSIGLALSINDWGLMRRSFRNLLILTGISIVISTIYFALSPITNAQSELLARTSPTIFDVLIATFGGMAGFIGISRAKQSNIIPGVAIATAIMPPLCTVGYGIGTMQPKFIFGAFYLFLINCIFICLSALVVATYMKLPKRDYRDKAQNKRVNQIISVIIIIIVTPAIYLAYTFVAQNNFNQNAGRFITTTFEDRGFVVIHKNLKYEPAHPIIELAFLSDHFSAEQIHEFEARLVDFGLADAKLTIKQSGFALTEEEWQSVMIEVKNDDEKVQALETRLESERAGFQSPDRLLREAQTIVPPITNLAVGTINFGVTYTAGETQQTVAIVYAATTSPLTQIEANVVTTWLKTRLDKTDLITYFVPNPIEIIPTDSLPAR